MEYISKYTIGQWYLTYAMLSKLYSVYFEFSFPAKIGQDPLWKLQEYTTKWALLYLLMQSTEMSLTTLVNSPTYVKFRIGVTFQSISPSLPEDIKIKLGVLYFIAYAVSNCINS